MRFRLEIDHVAVKTQTGTTYRPTSPIPDGDHRWRIVASDARGQETVGIDRFLRIDTAPPVVSIRLSGRARRGAATRFIASASDLTSGVASLSVDFGDGTKSVVPVKNGRVGGITHVYSMRGAQVVRALATDRAGNTRTASARVKVK